MSFALREFLGFFGVGIIATAVHYLVLVGLASGLGINPVLSAACGYICGAIVSYRVNYTVTFRSERRHSQAALRFLTVAVIGLIFNSVLVDFGISALGLHYLLAQILATGIVFVWNFVANKLWTF